MNWEYFKEVTYAPILYTSGVIAWIGVIAWLLS